jgi:N-succinyldiaminopimelate aminotransferase
MNPRLDTLQPYPFEKLRALLAQAGTLPKDLRPINLSIGEPKHAAPECIKTAMVGALAGLSVYPPTKGDPALRQAISAWIGRRYAMPSPDPETQVLPALGSRGRHCGVPQSVLSDL